MENKIILSIKNLNKSFGKSHVIKNVTLDIKEGEVFGFLGPNGSGKTTTIKMALGLLAIDLGSVYINGFDIEKEFEKAMTYVGAIVENPDMYEYLSGYDNLKLKARLFNVKKERIDEVVKLVDLTDRINDKVKKYSLGMKQRLGLAKALLHNPKLLILDEPTNGLDPAGIKELRDILKNLAHKEKVAVFVSSHLLSEMELMCDRVAVISKGEIIKIDNISNVLDNIQAGENEKESIIHTYNLVVSNILKLKEILDENKIKIKDINENSNSVIIETTENIIPKINIEMVNNKIDVYEIEKKKKSLEESFLNITKGGSKNE